MQSKGEKSMKYSEVSKVFNNHDDKFYVTEIDGSKYIITAEFSHCGPNAYEVQLREILSTGSFGSGVRAQISGDQEVTMKVVA